MNYERIILELLDRIKALEERVSKLENTKAEDARAEDVTPRDEITGGQKYRALSAYLEKSNLDRVRLSFSEIEEVIGTTLSPSARKNRANWANSTSQSLACSWLKVGYKTVEVNLTEEYAVFEKDPY